MATKFSLSPELAEQVRRVREAVDGRRSLVDTRAGLPAQSAAAAAARDEAVRKAQQLAAEVAVAERGHGKNVATLRRDLAVAREAIGKIDETAAGIAAADGGLAAKIEETDAAIVAAADELRPLAAAFRREVLQKLAAEHLEAARAFVGHFRRHHAIASALGLGTLTYALREARLPHPAEARGLLAQMQLMDGEASLSLADFASDPELRAQHDDLAVLAAVERRTAPAQERAAKRRQTEIEAANAAGRARAFSDQHKTVVYRPPEPEPPPPAPAESGQAERSWTSTWRDPPSPGSPPPAEPPASAETLRSHSPQRLGQVLP